MAGMVSGCETVESRSRKKVGDVGEFCGVFRRTYEEMGVNAMVSASERMRLSGRRERRPRKDALMGDRRGEVERAWDGRSGQDETEVFWRVLTRAGRSRVRSAFRIGILAFLEWLCTPSGTLKCLTMGKCYSQ